MASGKGRQRWDCKACGKVSFGSQARALETLQWSSGQSGDHSPVRAYPCPYSNGWHLTSKDLRT